MDRRTWSPFQSKRVREICEHMTEAERDEVARQAATYGIWAGITFAIPIGLVVMLWVAPKLGLPPSWFPVELRLAIYVLLVAVPIYIAGTIYFRRKQKQFLASTEWARGQGYTAHDL